MVHLRKCSQLSMAGLYISRWEMERHEMGPGQSVPINGMLSTYFAFFNSSLLSVTLEILQKFHVRNFPSDSLGNCRGEFDLRVMEA